MNNVKGKRVAIIVTDGFEQIEMTRPREALEKAAGCDTGTLACAAQTGVSVPHRIGPWLLISVRLMRGRHITSWPTLRDDLEDAGGRWEDKESGDLPVFNREMIALFSEAPRPTTEKKDAREVRI